MHFSPSMSLAHFVADADDECIPPSVRHEAKRALLNFFAVALAGHDDPTIRIAADVLGSAVAVRPEATVIGMGRSDIFTAAMLNAMSANVFDFDDTHLPTIIHPSAPVAPAVLALGERNRLSGRAVLTSFVFGVETACRLGNAISPGHYAKGWHITSTCGVFGAAAGAARLLRLDAQQLHWALGIAAGHASGTVEALGSRAKSASIGSSSRNGLMATLLAQAGFDGPKFPLEGERGFLRLVCDDVDMDRITNGLGIDWEILRNTYKPYPCGVVLNAVIDCALELRANPLLGADALASLERIEVTGNRLLLQRADRPSVTTGREAQLSAQHAVAITLMRGKAGLAEFDDAAANNSNVQQLKSKTIMIEDASYPVGAASVTIRWSDSRSLIATVKAATGDLSNPMTDSQLEDKLRRLSRNCKGGNDIGALIDMVWHLDQVEDIGSLLSYCRGGSAIAE